MEYRDYYATLGVGKDASQADIKKAFRRLARENHPDVNKGDAAAEKRFKEVSEANEVLSDPEKRAAYDKLGAVTTRDGADRQHLEALASLPWLDPARIRSRGLHVVVDADLTVRQGHAIANNVRFHVVNEIADVTRVIVHIDPDADS